MIRFFDIHKQFDGNPVLRGIDATLSAGRITAIIGESGCGKSVLLKHINRLIRPDRGRIQIRKQDLASMDNRQITALRRDTAMIFQNAALFDSMTVAENLAMGLVRHQRLNPEELAQAVAEVLHRVGLARIEARYPAQLSGGMRKRVAIARAIITRPSILLYDEPTTGLDPPRAAAINQLIVKLNREFGTTSIVVTHDVASLPDLADEVLLLHRGKVRFQGSVDCLMQTDDPVVRRFVHAKLEPSSMERDHVQTEI